MNKRGGDPAQVVHIRQHPMPYKIITQKILDNPVNANNYRYGHDNIKRSFDYCLFPQTCGGDHEYNGVFKDLEHSAKTFFKISEIKQERRAHKIYASKKMTGRSLKKLRSRSKIFFMIQAPIIRVEAISIREFEKVIVAKRA